MAIKTVGNLIPSTTDTPLDARFRVQSISDINLIENPYIGLTFFVIDEGKYYIVKSLTTKLIGTEYVDNAAILEYDEIPSTNEVIKMMQNIGGNEIIYTVNNKLADDNGNFTITSDDIGSAEIIHKHAISDINGMQDVINSKSPKDHTHNMVYSVEVGDKLLKSSVVIEGGENIIIKNDGNVISISGEPFAEDVAESIPNANTQQTKNLKMFTGTQEEWDNFNKDQNFDYVVFILD